MIDTLPELFGNDMEPFFVIYLACWSIACVAALVLYLRSRNQFDISRRDYWQFLSEPWKLTSFVIAAVGMIIVAPYTNDPTWDYVDAAFMSILTFITAPWAVGTLYKFLNGRESPKHAYVAACAWLFSASWSYDIYILWRDGHYPVTWLPNLFAASVLYVSAGLLWNLEWNPGRGTIFGFMRKDWPAPYPHTGIGKIVWFALPFMMIAASSVLYFLLP